MEVVKASSLCLKVILRMSEGNIENLVAPYWLFAPSLSLTGTIISGSVAVKRSGGTIATYLQPFYVSERREAIAVKELHGCVTFFTSLHHFEDQTNFYIQDSFEARFPKGV